MSETFQNNPQKYVELHPNAFENVEKAQLMAKASDVARTNATIWREASIIMRDASDTDTVTELPAKVEQAEQRMEDMVADAVSRGVLDDPMEDYEPFEYLMSDADMLLDATKGNHHYTHEFEATRLAHNIMKSKRRERIKHKFARISVQQWESDAERAEQDAAKGFDRFRR